MATRAEWVAILDAVDAELLALAAAPDEFELDAAGGGKLRVKTKRMSEIMRLRRTALRNIARIDGIKGAEPRVPGVDLLASTDNEDGV